MEIACLADNRYDGRLRFDERLHSGVVGRRNALAARHAERTQPAVFERLRGQSLEELGILRIGKRIATLDEVETTLIEPPGDEQLILQGEVHAFALGAVAERGVVDLNWFHGVLKAIVIIHYLLILR